MQAIVELLPLFLWAWLWCPYVCNCWNCLCCMDDLNLHWCRCWYWESCYKQFCSLLNFGAQFLFWVAICIPPRWRHYSCNKCTFWPLPTCLFFCNVCCERALQLHLMHLVAFSPLCFCLFFCHVLREGTNKLYWMHLLGFSLGLFVCLLVMCCERVKEKGLVFGRFSQLLRYGGWNTNGCSLCQASIFRSKRCVSKTPSSGTTVSCETQMHVLEKTFPTHCLQNASVSGRRTWQYNQCWVGPHGFLLSSCKNCTQDKATGADWRVSNALEGFSYSKHT